MSLDVELLQSNIDLQSIVPSIALATFFLSGLTVRSEVKEQGKEMKKAMSVQQKDLKEELKTLKEGMSVQQKELKEELSVQQKDLKEELSVQQKDLKEELSTQQKDLKEEVKMQLQGLKEDMGTQQKDLKEEIRTVKGEVSMQSFVEGFDLQFHASPFDLMLNVHAHFVVGDPNEALTS